MTPDKYVWPPGSAGQSTPWAIQFREDMDELAQVDESMSVWYNARASDLDIFLPGTEAHDRWPLVDPHILGNTKKRREVGPEGQGKEEEGIADEEVTLEELEKPHRCDHQEGGGGICGERFSSISALKRPRKRGAQHQGCPLQYSHHQSVPVVPLGVLYEEGGPRSLRACMSKTRSVPRG
eukprot:6350289-Pyramimonas_sp.AAC.2